MEHGLIQFSTSHLKIDQGILVSLCVCEDIPYHEEHFPDTVSFCLVLFEHLPLHH